MKGTIRSLSLILVTMTAFLAVSAVHAQERIAATPEGTQQVPAVISPGTAFFFATINEDGTEIQYNFTYENLRGEPLQAHLHMAQEGVNGGIFLFICTNLGNGPPGVPACPAPGDTVSGSWNQDDVVPIDSQGMNGGSFAFSRAIKAIRNGVAYVNLHSNLFPAGELRGQVRTSIQ